MEYFGYRIEPFKMKAERETGIIHEDGFVELNRAKENKNRFLFFCRKILYARDAWLDSLDEATETQTKIKRPAQREIEDDGDEKEETLDTKEKFHLVKELFDLLYPGS